MHAIEKMLEERKRLAEKLEEAVRRQREFAKMIEDIEAQASELDAALKVIRRFDSSIRSLQDLPEIRGHRPIVEVSMSKKEAVFSALKLNPGEKVRRIVEIAGERFGVEVERKTAGNILWQLKQEGLARREGQKWFPINSDKPRENAPSASANGAFS